MQHHTMKLIAHPFYICRINGFILDGQVESSLWDFQEDLKLSDEQITDLEESGKASLTNYECFDGSKKVVFTIANDAGLDNVGMLNVQDIFGNELELELERSVTESVTLDDLVQNSNPTNNQNVSQDPNEVLILEIPCDYLNENEGEDLSSLQATFSHAYRRNSILPDGVQAKTLQQVLCELNETDPENYFKILL